MAAIGGYVQRSRVVDTHYIAPIANLPSILERGILSHKLAESVGHVSIADEGVQDRRRGKCVPNGRVLHEYANTYFCARNPMMYKRLSRRRELTVIRIRPDILDAPGAVIADGNAAAGATRFQPSPAGLAMLDEQRVYAESWTDTDTWTYWEKKRQRCAELLIPDDVPPKFLLGCYVCDDNALRALRHTVTDIDVVVNAHVFFS